MLKVLVNQSCGVDASNIRHHLLPLVPTYLLTYLQEDATGREAQEGWLCKRLFSEQCSHILYPFSFL